MSDKKQNKFSREQFPTVNLDYGGARKKTWDELADEISRLSAEVETKELARMAALKTIDSLTASKATLSAENSRLAAKEEYALGHLEQALTIEKELRADVAARDDLLNEMCNVLQIISDGRNAAGSKIDRALYAETAHECLNDEWARVSTEPKRDLFEEIKEGLEAVRDSQNGNKADVSPKTAIEKDGINDRGSDEYANPERDEKGLAPND